MTNHRTIQPDARKVIVGVDTHKHVHVAVAIDTWGIPYGAKKRPRLGRCWSSLPSSLRLCRLRCSSSSSRSLAG